jgi:hypothetical protein
MEAAWAESDPVRKTDESMVITLLRKLVRNRIIKEKHYLSLETPFPSRGFRSGR